MKNFPAKLRLRGRFGQFNLTIFLILAALLVLCWFFVRHSNPWIQLPGSIFVCILIIVIVIMAFRFHIRQIPRVSEETPIVELHKDRLRLVNPPDSFYAPEHMKTILRGLLVGYDENLVPDGEVKGKVSDQNYRWYSDEEKQEFQKRHRAEIIGKREQIRMQLEAPEDIQKEDIQAPEDKKGTIETNYQSQKSEE